METLNAQELRDLVRDRVKKGQQIYPRYMQSRAAAKELGALNSVSNDSPDTFMFIRNIVSTVLGDIVFDLDRRITKGIFTPAPILRDLMKGMCSETIPTALNAEKKYAYLAPKMLDALDYDNMAELLERRVATNKTKVMEKACVTLETLFNIVDDTDKHAVRILPRHIVSKKTVINGRYWDYLDDLKRSIAALSILYDETGVDLRPAYQELRNSIKESNTAPKTKFGSQNVIELTIYAQHFAQRISLQAFEAITSFMHIYSGRKSWNDVYSMVLNHYNDKVALPA